MRPKLHVVLTAVSESDLALLHRWINDRELVIRSSSFRPVSWEEHRAWFERTQSRQDARLFGIRLTSNNELMGTCQLLGIHPVYSNAELRIRIGEMAMWGKGYGQEALQLLLAHAFGDLGLHRVYLHVFVSNTRAIKLYERVGFRREGVFREAARVNGLWVDVLAMGMLSEEFSSNA